MDPLEVLWIIQIRLRELIRSAEKERLVQSVVEKQPGYNGCGFKNIRWFWPRQVIHRKSPETPHKGHPISDPYCVVTEA